MNATGLTFGTNFLQNKHMNGKKKLELKGDVFILQMVSNRDKTSGKFNLLLDGNFNQCLHTIYECLDDIKHVTICIPENVTDTSLNEFDRINEKFFESKMSLILSDEYGSNAAEHRENFYSYAVYLNTNPYDMVVSDFGIKFFESTNVGKAVSKNIATKNVVYRYNCTKISDYDNKPSAKFFDSECNMAKHYDTYVYSDVQYDYFTSKGVPVYRMSNIFNMKLLKLLADDYIAQHEKDEKLSGYIDYIKDFMNSPIVFYPSRLEDPQYRFIDVCKFANEKNTTVLVTNPTNVSLPSIITENQITTPVFEVGCTDKRFEYFAWLNELNENDFIVRYDKEFHITLLENLYLSKATVLHEFDEDVVRSYVAE